MMSGMADRHTDFDVVLLGATGFTGGLAAEYLARHGPPGLRWALAGRDPGRLDAVRERVGRLGPAGATVDSVVTDATDEASLRSVTERTRVLATTVGPYARIGEPAVAACADTGTDYADLCGEREFVDLMWLRHHERALATGARIVHSCGFDSVPHDLGALFTVQQLPAEVPITIAAYVRAGGGISGGTYQSAVQSFSRVRTTAKVAEQRRRSAPATEGPLHKGAAGPTAAWSRRDRLGHPASDYRRRGRAPLGARARPLRPRLRLRPLRPDETSPGRCRDRGGTGRRGRRGAAATRRDLLLRARSAGRGPSDEQRAKSWFRVQFVGEADGRRVVTEVCGGDPGYDGAALMLGESALCLALDDLPSTAGQVTTAQSMGDSLRERIQAAGIEFRVVSST
jgi:saccharopine dehydrogenase (NAD+, L-glutamate forming)